MTEPSMAKAEAIWGSCEMAKAAATHSHDADLNVLPTSGQAGELADQQVDADDGADGHEQVGDADTAAARPARAPRRRRGRPRRRGARSASSCPGSAGGGRPATARRAGCRGSRLGEPVGPERPVGGGRGPFDADHLGRPDEQVDGVVALAGAGAGYEACEKSSKTRASVGGDGDGIGADPALGDPGLRQEGQLVPGVVEDGVAQRSPSSSASGVPAVVPGHEQGVVAAAGGTGGHHLGHPDTGLLRQSAAGRPSARPGAGGSRSGSCPVPLYQTDRHSWLKKRESRASRPMTATGLGRPARRRASPGSSTSARARGATRRSDGSRPRSRRASVTCSVDGRPRRRAGRPGGRGRRRPSPGPRCRGRRSRRPSTARTALTAQTSRTA